ncbi:beta-1,3-galactosyltransferase 5-like [Pseudophryne corroboree]|uniref:beta-1,3-galactosyltransferase 5-like n=1 Tax=Pseudophryne corroboree TaxID=495146 RepID=UPI0030812F0C
MKIQVRALYSVLLVFTLMLLIRTMFLYTEKTRRKSLHHSSNFWLKFINFTTTKNAAPLTLHPMRESVTLNDGVHTYHLNLSRFLVEFPYLQSYRCSVIHDPKRETQATRNLVILAIKSHPQAGVRRQALRKTWARKWEIDGYSVRPIFLLGRIDVLGHMEMVTTESREFGDILQWDSAEGHHNLSLKECCFLEWLHHNIPEVSFVYKGDDDEYVNPHALVRYIKEHTISPQVLYGYLRPHSPVMRFSKYQVSESLFPSDTYPTFLSGGGFIFPGLSAKLLYEMSQKIPVFPLDDVYFGFLALAANLTYKHDARFHVYGLKFDACQYRQALVVHGLEQEQLVKCWKEVQHAKC